MPTLFNPEYFADLKAAVSDFNSETAIYNDAVQSLRDAAAELEGRRETLATELQCVLDTLEEARSNVQSALDELPSEISEPGDCDDVDQIEIDFDAITN